jgi:hypothetical protein
MKVDEYALATFKIGSGCSDCRCLRRPQLMTAKCCGTLAGFIASEDILSFLLL